MRAVARIGVAIALGMICFGVAGLAGGAIPVNAGWREPAEGVEIFVESNGIHTGIVVPKAAAGVDWRGLARGEHLADPRYAGHGHLAIGWGERNFYLATPTWWDVRPATVLAAAVGSDDTLLHVEHVARPVAGPDVRRVLLRPEEYRRLTAFIRGYMAVGAPVKGYGAYDVFYPSNRRYSAVDDCNAWTGEALAAAGVRVGAWTPFPGTVLWWF